MAAVVLASRDAERTAALIRRLGQGGAAGAEEENRPRAVRGVDRAGGATGRSLWQAGCRRSFTAFL